MDKKTDEGTDDEGTDDEGTDRWMDRQTNRERDRRPEGRTRQTNRKIGR
jgi:hypothetical protein